MKYLWPQSLNSFERGWIIDLLTILSEAGNMFNYLDMAHLLINNGKIFEYKNKSWSGINSIELTELIVKYSVNC